MEKWDIGDKRFLTRHSHTHILTFASVDSRSDVRVGQKIGDRHGVGGCVVPDAEAGDICCRWRARGRLYWCQWIDFIPPRCQKPPAPFCLLSPAADHSEAACVRPQHWGTLQKRLLRYRNTMNQIDMFEIKTVEVHQICAFIHFSWRKASVVPEVGFLGLQTSVITAPWIRPSPLMVASKPLQKWQKFLSVTK